MEYFNYLPAEITSDILTRLPTESVLDSKLVCTHWRTLIRQPSFRQVHFRRLSNSASDSGKLEFIARFTDENICYFEYNDESTPAIQRFRQFNFTLPFRRCSIVGSCNGLICFAGYHPSVCICNPITREQVLLPAIKSDPIEIKSDNVYVFTSFEFGWVSSTNEYKVVGIKRTNPVEFHIYTLGSGKGWRSLGKVNSQLETHRWRRGISASGALYWMDYEYERIITFDLAEEKFCEYLSPPSLPPENDWSENAIGVLDGCLFFAAYLTVEESKCFDIWLLKKHVKKIGEGHRSCVWSKEFRIDYSQLLAATKSGGVLTYGYDYLNIYDTKASISNRLVDLKELSSQIFQHKNTLVSIKELGEDDVKIIESVEIGQTERAMTSLSIQPAVGG